jgi:excisionase family DNA binding protein
MTAAGSTTQISRHLTAEGCVIVPPRIADWIEKQIGLVSERRIALADTDPLAYAVLSALRLVALQQRTGNGTKSAAVQSSPEELTVWLTTQEAAADAEVTDSCIRKRIRSGRLPAIKRGGRYLINRNDLQAQAFAA